MQFFGNIVSYITVQYVIIFSEWEVLFMPENRTLIIWATVIILVIVCQYLVYRRLTKKYYKKRITHIEDRLEIITSLPIRFKLDKIKKIASYNSGYQAGYEVWNGEYQKLLIDEHHIIVSLLKATKTLIKQREYHDAKGALASLLVEIEKWEVRVNELLKEVDALTEIDSLQRTEISKYKEAFRNLKAIYQRDRVIMDGVSAYIDEDVVAIENAMMSFDKLLSRAEFEKTSTLIHEISDALIKLAKSIDLVPQIITYVDTIIPQRGHELIDLYSEAKRLGARLDHINLNPNLIEIDGKISEVNTLIKTRDYLKAEPIINGIIKLLNEMKKDTQIELESKVRFDEVYQKTLQSIENIIQVYINIKAEIQTAFSTYELLHEDMTLTDELDRTLKSLKEMKHSFEAKIVNPNEIVSYTVLIKNIEELTKEATLSQKLLQQQEEVLENKTIDTRIMEKEFTKLTNAIIEIEDMMLNPIINNFANNYGDMIIRAKNMMDELELQRYRKPVNIEQLKSSLSDTKKHIRGLYNAVFNVLEEATLAERAIVWANRYRTSITGAEAMLSNAEILFKAGKFGESIEVSIKLIEMIKPGLYNANPSTEK